MRGRGTLLYSGDHTQCPHTCSVSWLDTWVIGLRYCLKHLIQLSWHITLTVSLKDLVVMGLEEKRRAYEHAQSVKYDIKQ